MVELLAPKIAQITMELGKAGTVTLSCPVCKRWYGTQFVWDGQDAAEWAAAKKVNRELLAHMMRHTKTELMERCIREVVG